ncbi:MAG: UbiX family flavin prenyltransferase [SAR202 cluster bacterium]|nr:UbiX family flavin prenyltransferase [SAR202 cluster bacterium]|tara:strand:+ start:1940 stop:2527 length:588 start_codon:yes stop_codon:yes gene_type:complete
MDPVVVGISGASGSILAKRTVEMLIDRDIPVIMTCTAAARMVWQEEMDETFNAALARWGEFPYFKYYPIGDLKAPIASGTMPTSGMIITPCSVGTLAAIANGLSSNLLQRSADVCIKEKRKLVLVPRETPLSSIHLENMLRVSNLGVAILPPVPAFYLKPRSIDDVVEYIVAKTIDSLGLSGFMNDDLRYQRSTE